MYQSEVFSVRDILDGRDSCAGDIGMLLHIVVVLRECEADAVGKPAVSLSVYGCRIADDAYVIHRGHAEDGGLAGLDVDFHLGHEQRVGEVRRRVSDSGVRIEIAQIRIFRISGVAFIFGRDTFGNHFSVGSECAVRLFHGVDQLVGGLLGGFAVGIVLTGCGGCAGVRAIFAVVLDQHDVVHGDAQRLQCFQGVLQGTDVAALAYILPGVVFHELAVFTKFYGNGSGVCRSVCYVISAPGKAYASSLFRGVFRLGFFNRCVIVRLHGLHDLFHRIVDELVAVHVGLAFPGDVSPSDLKWIQAGFFRQHIHDGFRSRIGLRRAVASIGCSVGMVGGAGSGKARHVRYIVWEEHESCRSAEDVVAQLVVGAVVEAQIPLCCDELAVLVAGQTGVGVGR